MRSFTHTFLALALLLPLAASVAAASGDVSPAGRSPVGTKDKTPPPPTPQNPPEGVGIARFTDIFTPFRTDQASLSPDGRHLAFSWFDGRELSVAVVEMANPRVATCRVIIDRDESTPQRNTYPGEFSPPRILFLRWVSPTRVALQANTPVSFGVGLRKVSMRGVWFAFDADGGNARVLYDPRDVVVWTGTPKNPKTMPAMLQPVDVDPALNGGIFLRRTEWDYSDRQRPVKTEFWYRTDALTGAVRPLKKPEQVQAEADVEARHGRFSAELRTAATELAEVLPLRTIDLLECDETARYFLARVQGGADAGGFQVFDRKKRQSYEMIRRAEHLDTARTVGSIPFEFPAPAGPPLRGVLTLPRQARLRPFPAIVICPPKANDKHLTRFRPEILAFADMGLAVIQLEGALARITDRAELGTNTPETDAARILAAIDAIAAGHPVSTKRVVLYGESQGALLALRTFHHHRERFRSVITVQPSLPFGRWADDKLLRAAKPGQPPIQLWSYPGPIERVPDYREALQLASTLRRRGGTVEFQKLTADDLTGVPAARARTFREVEGFINLSLYDYTVELGELREVTE